MAQSSANYNILSNTVDIGGTAVSAFGTIETGELTPLVQLDFVYGINTQTGVSTVANSATVDTNTSRLRLQCGTNSAGSAIFTSRNTAKYRPGQGITARFTGVYGAGTNNNTQIIGVGTSSDGYFFGYNGTSFGILLKTGGSSTWIAQTAWNGDTCDGNGGSAFNWNHQTGNVMMIKYPYLGFGAIKFYVSSPLGVWILCHTIQYPNTTTAVQVSNPNLSFYAQNINSGNTSNLIMYVGSVGIFLSGKRSYVGSPKWAIGNSKTSITTETNIFSIKNCTTFNGVTNKSLIRLNSITWGTASAKGLAFLRLKLGVTLGGSPSYTPISGTATDTGVATIITSGNSTASYDTAGTTITNGTLVFNMASVDVNSSVIDLVPYDLFIAPTEVLTFSISSTVSADCAVAVNWSEDI